MVDSPKKHETEPQLFTRTKAPESATIQSARSTVNKTPNSADPSENRRTRFTTKEDRQEFYLPVSGFVWFYPEEIQLINHPAFQHLGRIYQLGQTFVVYRGATHKRLEHVLGSVGVVQRMIEAVQHNGRKGRKKPRPGTTGLSEEEQRFVRLGTLLHDIGHLAAGHTVEDELFLVGRHDADKRLDLVFKGADWADKSNLTLAELIDKTCTQYVPDDLASKGITASEIVRILIRKLPTGDEEKRDDPHANSQAVLEQASSIRMNVCRDLIGNTICADLLDYLHRDWYHIGKPRQFDDRILQYMEIRTRASDLAGEPTPSHEDMFVISLGQSPKLRTDAISNILELLEWRYQLMESVIYHRTKLAAAAMLDRALYELWGRGDDSEIESTLLPLNDEEMLSKCLSLAQQLEKQNAETAKQRGKVAAKLLEALEKRQLFEQVSTRFYGDLRPGIVTRIQGAFGKVAGDRRRGSRNRNLVLRMLESDFNLEAGALAMYCPGGVNEKIAEVKIAVGAEILPFCKYEDKYGKELSGGHLDAQLHRFQRLWRVHFFIDRTAKARLGLQFPLLQRAIEKLALHDFVDDESDVSVSRSLAIELSQTEGSPWQGRKVREVPVVAAYQDPELSTGKYPLGPNSIRSYLE